MNRTFSADLLNDVANDPEVRSFLGGDGSVDVSALLSDPNNIALVDDVGGFVMIRQEAGLYDCHTLYPPEARGRHALQAAQQVFRWMFTRTDATALSGVFPASNQRVEGFGKLLGFQMVHERLTHLGTAQCGFLTLEKWVGSDLSRCLEIARYQPMKGVWIYNRIARLMGMTEMELVSERPALLRIGARMIDPESEQCL